jgi:hypothetical protein
LQLQECKVPRMEGFAEEQDDEADLMISWEYIYSLADPMTAVSQRVSCWESHLRQYRYRSSSGLRRFLSLSSANTAVCKYFNGLAWPEYRYSQIFDHRSKQMKVSIAQVQARSPQRWLLKSCTGKGADARILCTAHSL